MKFLSFFNVLFLVVLQVSKARATPGVRLMGLRDMQLGLNAGAAGVGAVVAYNPMVIDKFSAGQTTTHS